MQDGILKDLASVPILVELSQEELETIASYWEYKTLESNDILFSEGDVADAIYYVVEGEFVIYKDSSGPIPMELTRVKKDQFFGEQAVLEKSVRSGTLQAAEPSCVLMLSKDNFYEIINKYPHIGVVLLKGIARYLSMQLRATTGQFVNACGL